MERRGQVAMKASAWRFPREWKSHWGCAVVMSRPPPPFFAPVLPGPGREVRSVLGWTSAQTTERSGGMVIPGCLERAECFSALSAAGDWVKKGSYHTAWAVPSTFFVFLLICSWAGHGCRATHRGCGAGHCFVGCGGLSHP